MPSRSNRTPVTFTVPEHTVCLGAGFTTLQWILAGYSPTFGLALVPAGRLGGMYGRRLLFAGGLAMFAVIALGVAVASVAAALDAVAMGVLGGDPARVGGDAWRRILEPVTS